MKDNRLEKEFDEYFKGVNIRDDITADAKKSVQYKRKSLPGIAKYLSIAASIVLVFAVSLAVIFNTDFNKKAGNDGEMSGDNSSGGSSGDDYEGDPDYGADDGDGDESGPPSAGTSYLYYTDKDLENQTVGTVTLSSLNPALKFIEETSTKETCTAGYMDEELALIIAEIKLESDEATVFVEFTEEKVVYSSLADYYDGEINYWNGVKYYLTEGDESKLLILNGGVKYYFEIHSADKDAYKNYLNAIIK